MTLFTFRILVALVDFCNSLLFVPETNLNTGKHAFFEAVSTIWNQLHITIKSSEIIATFCKKKLKTICFELAFSPQMFGGSTVFHTPVMNLAYPGL